MRVVSADRHRGDIQASAGGCSLIVAGAAAVLVMEDAAASFSTVYEAVDIQVFLHAVEGDRGEAGHAWSLPEPSTAL